MRRKLHLIALALILSSPAFAQQLSANDRIAIQIGQLVIRLETQQDQIAALQKQLDDAKAEAKRLKEKYEPAKDQPPK